MSTTKILLVEDDDAAREGLKKYLTLTGLEVVEFGDGEAAIKHLKKTAVKYRAIILDWILDGRAEGADVLGTAVKIHPAVPVLVVTGSDETGANALNLGATSYLHKPLDPEVLRMMIQNLSHPVPAARAQRNTAARIDAMHATALERNPGDGKGPDVFVLMPFDPIYTGFYEQVIKKTIEHHGLSCNRVDDFFESTVIMNDIVNCIAGARFLLADCSGRNANVFFEIGIAHALGKSTLLFTRQLGDVPSKLRVLRFHVYQDSLAGAEETVRFLNTAIREVQKKHSPVFRKRKKAVVPHTALAILPDTEDGNRTYKHLVVHAMDALDIAYSKSEDVFHSVSVLDETWNRIQRAEIVVADLTGRDADVFYLAGLAYGLKKKLVFLARSEEDVPFDLRNGSWIKYALEPLSQGLSARQQLLQELTNLAE